MQLNLPDRFPVSGFGALALGFAFPRRLVELSTFGQDSSVLIAMSLGRGNEPAAAMAMRAVLPHSEAADPLPRCS